MTIRRLLEKFLFKQNLEWNFKLRRTISISSSSRTTETARTISISSSSRTETASRYPKQKEKNIKICYKNAIKKLQELLDLRFLDAKEVLLKYPKFSELNINNLDQNYNFYLSAGVSKDTLKKYPEILAQSDTFRKLEKLKALPYDLNVTVPLVQTETIKLNKFITNEKHVKKIEFMSKLLKVEKHEVCKWLSNRPFLISLSMEQLQTNVNLLLDYGVTKEDIIKDLWVLRYSTSTIEKRLKVAKERNIKPIKTWMVRAPLVVFENHIRRQYDNKFILGGNSLVEYLSARLECSEAIAKYIILKQSALEGKCLKKMNEMIDFLLVKGFKKIHICRAPKILLHRVETVKKRLNEVETLGVQLDALHVLTKSQKQFSQSLESLKPNKNKIAKV